MDHKETGRYWNESVGVWTKLARAGYDISRDHLNTPAAFRTCVCGSPLLHQSRPTKSNVSVTTVEASREAFSSRLSRLILDA